MLKELNELEYQHAFDTESLLNYFKKWHYNKEHYYRTMHEIDRKRFVIDSLGYRGYGVNRDLHQALDALNNEYAGHTYRLLTERFNKHIELAKKLIYLPQERIDSMDSHYIIGELCKKLNWSPDENIPVLPSARLDLGRYFHVMSHETSWSANTAIFQKLFLNLGSSSMTIMRGSAGYHNQLSDRDLKIIGNNNFIELYRELFSSLHTFSFVGTDLLKRIHYVLSKGIDPNAGNFRTCDFADKNGVTFEHGNFQRELGDLSHVLWETGQSFHDLEAFIFNLSRSYYMFLGIHPFGDSNGRTGKCFLNFLLLKKGLPPVSFTDEKEIFALPRYGGSVEDMHDYIKTRIMTAVNLYFYERWKLERLGFLSKSIYNVSFDSGFHFRQIDDMPRKLEVNFTAYVIGEGNPLDPQLRDQCMIVLPNEQLIRNMTIYCGFSHSQGGEWRHVFHLKNNFFIREIRPETRGVRVFDIDFVVELRNEHFHYDYFNCCVVSHEAGRTFNNKGLNYSYRIDRG
jgi:fido (protein-threonine AMPylation protein)